MVTKTKPEQQPNMMRMHRLNRFDAQLKAMGNNNPKRRAVLEKRRGMVHDKLVTALQHRIQTLETKIANNATNDKRRSVLEQRLEAVTEKKAMVDLPFEERIRACLDSEAPNPHQRAQLAFWMERPMMKTMGRDERLQFIQAKVDSSTTKEAKTFYEAVLRRMQHRRPGAPGHVEERILRIQTRLQTTDDANIRKVLEQRLAKLELRAGSKDRASTPEDVRAKLGARLGAMQGKRCGVAMQGLRCGVPLANRIHRLETKISQATEPGEVDRLTKHLDQLKKRFNNQNISREERMLQLQTQLQSTENEEERRKLQQRLDNMTKGGPGGAGGSRMNRMERRLASCTNPTQKAKIQSRLDAMKQRNLVDHQVDMLGHQLQDVTVDDDDVVIVDPAEAVEAMDKSA